MAFMFSPLVLIQIVDCDSMWSVFFTQQAIVTRKNSLSRIKYSEEPAIFAWELINEPRCSSNSSASVLQVSDNNFSQTDDLLSIIELLI